MSVQMLDKYITVNIICTTIKRDSWCVLSKSVKASWLHYVTHITHRAPARKLLLETRLATGCKCMVSAAANTNVDKMNTIHKFYTIEYGYNTLNNRI